MLQLSAVVMNVVLTMTAPDGSKVVEDYLFESDSIISCREMIDLFNPNLGYTRSEQLSYKFNLARISCVTK